MIATHEEAVIAFTTDREELIKESRQNELYGEQIIQIIKSKCPSILGKCTAPLLNILAHLRLFRQIAALCRGHPVQLQANCAINRAYYPR